MTDTRVVPVEFNGVSEIYRYACHKCGESVEIKVSVAAPEERRVAQRRDRTTYKPRSYGKRTRFDRRSPVNVTPKERRVAQRRVREDRSNRQMRRLGVYDRRSPVNAATFAEKLSGPCPVCKGNSSPVNAAPELGDLTIKEYLAKCNAERKTAAPVTFGQRYDEATIKARGHAAPIPGTDEAWDYRTLGADERYAAPINQCDGCARGLPINEHGNMQSEIDNLRAALAALEQENEVLREQNLAMNATCVRYESASRELPEYPAHDKSCSIYIRDNTCSCGYFSRVANYEPSLRSHTTALKVERDQWQTRFNGISDDLACSLRQHENTKAALAAVRANTIEECAKVCDVIGLDWRDAGDWNKFYAAYYLVEAIRALAAKEEAALAAAQKDAERYRWLREEIKRGADWVVNVNIGHDWPPVCDLDAAIDAAKEKA